MALSNSKLGKGSGRSKQGGLKKALGGFVGGRPWGGSLRSGWMERSFWILTIFHGPTIFPVSLCTRYCQGHLRLWRGRKTSKVSQSEDCGTGTGRSGLLSQLGIWEIRKLKARDMVSSPKWEKSYGIGNINRASPTSQRLKFHLINGR